MGMFGQRLVTLLVTTKNLSVTPPDFVGADACWNPTAFFAVDDAG
jgi:hypothetical protein